MGEREYEIYVSVDMDLLETQQTEQVLEIVVTASVMSVAVVGVGLLVYFRKHNGQLGTTFL